MRFSIEAEQSVIGGLLIDPSKLDDVCELITDADYYNSDNRAVFAAICAMANDNQPIDVITLSEKLDAMGELERVGGIGYLIEMHNNTPSAANIMSYARIIADRSMDRRIVESGIRICQLGEKDGDVDEKLNTLHGELEALERKDDAGYVGFDSILKTCIQRIDEKHRGKQVDCIKTGFTALDERLVVEPTDFWVIAARPAMGKTALAMNIAYSVANTGKEVIVFSMEMSKEQLMDRLLCAASGVPADVIRSGKLEGDQWNNLSMGVAKLKGLKIHIIEIPAIDINRALAISRKFAKRGNVGLIVVDYLQLMTQDADIISFIYRDEYYNEDSPNKGCAEIITRKYRNGEIGTDIIGTQFQYSRFINIDFSNYQFNTEQQAKPRKGFD